MKKCKLCSNMDLTPLNSFGVKALAENFFCFESVQELIELFEQNPEAKENYRVLGFGNNILLSSELDCVIVHPIGKKIIRETHEIVYAQAGVLWDDLVQWSIDNKLWGLENLSLIPSSVGAAPVQNIGAYGVEVKDFIVDVEVFLPQTNQVLRLTNEQCQFAYRDSIFKREYNAIIIGVRFLLNEKGAPKLDYGALKSVVSSKGEPSLSNIRESVIEIRNSKLPDPKVLGNVGSFFQNPIVDKAFAKELQTKYPNMPTYETSDESKVKIAAGWLIDTAGWKGVSEGRVGVHSTQALVLVNLGGASGEEIINFAHKIIQDIFIKFAIKIQMEVNVW